MNGAGQHYQAPVPNGITSPLGTGEPAAAPVVTFQQVALTAAQIRNLFLGAVGLISAGISAGWLFMPAKEADLKAVTAIVETLRTEADQNREAVTRLTVAVDNLSRLVSDLSDRPPAVIVPPPPPARRTAPANGARAGAVR